MSANLGEIWFNYESKNNFNNIDLNNLEDEVVENIIQNYAGTVFSPINSDFFILAFKDVEDHVDGNGLSTFFLKKGSGIFYYDNKAIKMKENDVVFFDDNIEHGFASEKICLAVNITWGKYIPNIEEVKEKIEKCIYSCNNPIKKLKKF